MLFRGSIHLWFTHLFPFIADYDDDARDDDSDENSQCDFA